MLSIQDAARADIQRYSDGQLADGGHRVPSGLLDLQAGRAVELYEKLKVAHSRVILGDPVGTGKTAVALVAARELVRRTAVTHVIISTPNSPVSQLWVNRAGWVFDEVMSVGATARHARSGVPVVISRHGKGSVKLPTTLERDKVLVIIDEAHRGLQHESNDSYARLKNMAKGCRVLLVTANPYQLEVGGLEAMLSVGHRAELPELMLYAKSLSELVRLKRQTTDGIAVADDSVVEAKEACRAGCVAALKEIAPFMLSPFDLAAAKVPRPPKLLGHVVQVDSEWRTAYHVARVMPEFLSVGKGDMFQRRLISSSEAFWSGAAGKELVVRARSRGVTPFIEQLRSRLGASTQHPKVMATVDWVEQRHQAGRHVVVFTHFHATRDALVDALKERSVGSATFAPIDVKELDRAVDGGVPLKDRIRDPKAPPLVLVLTDRFSESIDLDGGNPCLVHHDLVWNPVRLEQRWGRLVRISSGFKPVRPSDIFVPVLDLEVDHRLLKTVKGRQQISNVLLPLRLDPEESDIDLLDEDLETILGAGRPRDTPVVG